MINFDEEIKKFYPSLEIDQVEDAIYNENQITDMTDVMLQMMEDMKKKVWVSPSLEPVNGKIIGCGASDYLKIADRCIKKGFVQAPYRGCGG